MAYCAYAECDPGHEADAAYGILAANKIPEQLLARR
jgi:hypothetical protein